MPAFANIVGTDYGAHGATPVTHTFIPNELGSDGVATYVEAGATPLDDLKVTVSKRTVKESGRIKFILKLQWPITATETINGVAYPKLIRTGFAELTLTADAASTLQERENLAILMRTIMDTTDQPYIVWTTNSAVY